MKSSEDCKVAHHCKHYIREIVGAVLLIIATFLTIVSLSGLGIAAMFFVGLFLCCRKHFHCHPCVETCHDECADESCDDEAAVKKSTAKSKK